MPSTRIDGHNLAPLSSLNSTTSSIEADRSGKRGSVGADSDIASTSSGTASTTDHVAKSAQSSFASEAADFTRSHRQALKDNPDKVSRSEIIQVGTLVGAHSAGLYKGLAKYVFGRGKQEAATAVKLKNANKIFEPLKEHGILGLGLRGAAALVGGALGAVWDGNQGSAAKWSNSFAKAADRGAAYSRMLTQSAPQFGLMALGIAGGGLVKAATVATQVGAMVGAEALKGTPGGIKGVGRGFARGVQKSFAKQEPEASPVTKVQTPFELASQTPFEDDDVSVQGRRDEDEKVGVHRSGSEDEKISVHDGPSGSVGSNEL